MNYNHLYYFHVVATEGSITRSAEKLGLAPATVSEQVRQLERAMGALLFERTPGGLRLTDGGRRAFAQTSLMFAAAARLEEDVSLAATSARTLDVGISASASRGVATDFLTPILALEGTIPVVRSGHSAELLRRLGSGELDLVLSEETGAAANGLVATEIHRPRLVVVTSPDGAATWRERPLVTYLPESPLRPEVDSFVRDRSLAVILAAETDDAHFMVEIAARGLAFAIVPRSVARDAVLQKRVVVAEVLPPSNVAVHAIYRSAKDEQRLRRAIELLLLYARERLDPGP